MSSIETYLQYIANKVWARDVRTAIVNAIRQCYDDVHNPTLNTEALQAAIQAKIDAGQMAALTIGDRTITAAKLALGVIPTPDATLSQSGVPADAKKTGDEISALQADLANQTGLYHWNERGFIDLSGSSVNLTPEANQGIDYAVIDCSAGDKFIITGTGGNKSRVWGFIDSNNLILTVSDANATVENFEITAPTNAAKLILNAYKNSDKYAYKVGNNLASKVDALEKNGNGLSNDIKAAILACLKNVPWNDNGDNYYDVLTRYLQLDVLSITAVFTQGNNIITQTDELGDLRPMLTVTADFGDHTAEIQSYSLSGELEYPTSNITVTYGSVYTNFTVSVSKLPSGYHKENYVEADGSQYMASGIYETDMDGTWTRYKACIPKPNSDTNENRHILSSAQEFTPHARYFSASGALRVSATRFGSLTYLYDAPGSLLEFDKDFTVESYKHGGEIWIDKVHRSTIVPGVNKSNSNQLYFFAVGGYLSTEAWRFKGKLYYFKVFSATGTKLHDFVPCRNPSDVAGLYDMVTGIFHAPDVGTLITY